MQNCVENDEDGFEEAGSTEFEEAGSVARTGVPDLESKIRLRKILQV